MCALLFSPSIVIVVVSFRLLFYVIFIWRQLEQSITMFVVGVLLWCFVASLFIIIVIIICMIIIVNAFHAARFVVVVVLNGVLYL